MKTNKLLIGIIIIVIIIALSLVIPVEKDDLEIVKIGLITPLTGGSAYWGEGTISGAILLEKDLKQKGVNVEFVFEDGSLDPRVALDSAQKLVNVDNVDALYVEFNPATVAVSSFVKDKSVHFLYDSAPVSSLEVSPYYFKTYLDYGQNCKAISKVLKQRGIERPGMLKMNLELGDLCFEGVKEIYGDNVVVEEFNQGEIDFRTHITKLKEKNVDVLINISFLPEILRSFKDAEILGLDVLKVTLTEIINDEILEENPGIFEGVLFFGLPEPAVEYVERINNEYGEIQQYQSSALAYIHLNQLVNVVTECGDDKECGKRVLESSRPEDVIGFKGFKNRIAQFEETFHEMINGELVRVK